MRIAPQIRRKATAHQTLIIQSMPPVRTSTTKSCPAYAGMTTHRLCMEVAISPRDQAQAGHRECRRYPVVVHPVPVVARLVVARAAGQACWVVVLRACRQRFSPGAVFRPPVRRVLVRDLARVGLAG